MDGFTKRVLRIPIEKPFDEAYFTHRLWMLFREKKVTEEDIRRMFHQVREKMKHRITLTKKSDPGKFAIPCLTVTDDRNNTSLDVTHPVDHFASPIHCYQHFAFQPPSKRGHDYYSIGSWAYSGFHESFAVDTDERFETHEFTNTIPTSFDAVHSISVDTHPCPAKQPLTSIDTYIGTSIDIRGAAKIQEANTQAKRMNTLPSTPTEQSMKINHLKNTSSAELTLLSIDATESTSIDTTLNPNLWTQMPTHVQWMEGSYKYVIQTDPNNHVGVATTEINPDLSRQPKGQASIDGTTETSIDRVTPTSIDRDDPTSIDRRYEFGNRAFDMYGARKFTWEQRDEYGVYRDECGHARDVAELYTKDEIDEMVFGICGAQEKLGEELKTLVEDTHHPLDRGYNELFRSMAEMRIEIESLRQQLEKEATTSASIDAPHSTSIDVSLPTAQIPAEPQCSTQHMDEWEVSYIDTRINNVYCPLNNNQDLDTIRKKDQQPATSIDMCTFTSLDAKVSAMNERLRTYEDMHDRFISPAKSASIDRLRGPWIDGKKPVELLPYTAAEVDKITSKIYTALDTMEERLDKRCDDIYFPFDNKISGLDSHAEWLQKEVKAIQRQLAAQHQISASIDRTQRNRSMATRRDRPTNT
ncbi:hypothetical protein IGI04_030630 [Brassica rapa subsp. trilocularis]|uniref:Uncharacterized protein n=1 Tax=Brassica rapa subsp. trilocularis TaxID=1813537 RepID=A0ABQ7LRB8_BRACM|nr:hypothetical protein IGI04_030630 [Brassica rapa subsp. trilocularis]